MAAGDSCHFEPALTAPEAVALVSEVNGSWQRALQVPGLAALDKAGIAEVMSVSCSAAGRCAAGGDYYNGGIGSVAFMVTASDGL